LMLSSHDERTCTMEHNEECTGEVNFKHLGCNTKILH
jgi:hypothetical protein